MGFLKYTPMGTEVPPLKKTATQELTEIIWDIQLKLPSACVTPLSSPQQPPCVDAAGEKGAHPIRLVVN